MEWRRRSSISDVAVPKTFDFGAKTRSVRVQEAVVSTAPEPIGPSRMQNVY
jgi:hypothetical protein